MSMFKIVGIVILLLGMHHAQGQAWYADHHKRLPMDHMIARITQHAERMAAQRGAAAQHIA